MYIKTVILSINNNNIHNQKRHNFPYPVLSLSWEGEIQKKQEANKLGAQLPNRKRNIGQGISDAQAISPNTNSNKFVSP